MEREIAVLERDFDILRQNVVEMEAKVRSLSARVRQSERLRQQNFSELLYRREFHPCLYCYFRNHVRVSQSRDSISDLLGTLRLDSPGLGLPILAPDGVAADVGFDEVDGIPVGRGGRVASAQMVSVLYNC